MALTNDYLPKLMGIYNDRSSAAGQVLNPQNLGINYNAEVPTANPNPDYGNTWADINQMYNPGGARSDQWLSQFSNFANNPQYTSMYGPAPTNGSRQDQLDWMTLLNAGGGMRSGEQNSKFGSFMGDYGFLLPMGAAAGAAAFGPAAASAAGAAGSAGGAMDMGVGLQGLFNGGATNALGAGGAMDMGVGIGGVEGGGGNMFDWGDIINNAFGNSGSGLANMGNAGSPDFSDWGPGNNANAGPMGSGGPGAGDVPGYPSGGYQTGNPMDWARYANTARSLLSGSGGNGSSDGSVDWNRLLTGGLGAILGQQNQNKMFDQMNGNLNMINQNQFPFRDFQKQAYDFADPNKRYQMLLDSPAYRASQDYVTQEQTRRNARNGELNAGFGKSLLADVIGKNAAAWDAQNFGQIEKMSGMDFNNANAIAEATKLLPLMYGNQNKIYQDIGTTVGNSGILPWLFKQGGSLIDSIFGGP